MPSDADGSLNDAIAGGVTRPVHAGDHDYGQIVALTGGPTLDDDGVLALERASMAIAVRLAQASAVAEAQERFAAMSLEELIAGHVGNRRRHRGAGQQLRMGPRTPTGRAPGIGRPAHR